MSTTPKQNRPTVDPREARVSEMEALAEQLLALAEEFEAALRNGHVSPALTDRLAPLRRAVDHLI